MHTDEPMIQALLEDILGSSSTIEAACRACPELLPEVRRRLARIRDFEGELDGLFPRPDAPGHEPPSAGANLPRVPGYVVEKIVGQGS